MGWRTTARRRADGLIDISPSIGQAFFNRFSALQMAGGRSWWAFGRCLKSQPMAWTPPIPTPTLSGVNPDNLGRPNEPCGCMALVCRQLTAASSSFACCCIS